MQHNTNQTQNFREFSFPTLNSNKVFLGGESPTQQPYHPQLQAESQYPTIGNPFCNPFLSTQSNFKSGLQQQHGLLFGMQDPQGLQKTVTENASYRPNLAFNSGYHNSLGDCNLNNNVSHGATYSGCKAISNTHIGNPIFHDNNLNANANNVTTRLGRGMILDTRDENTSSHELGGININVQQDRSLSKMSNSSNEVVASYEREIEESNAIEKEIWDAYFDFNNIDYLSQDPEPPTE